MGMHGRSTISGVFSAAVILAAGTARAQSTGAYDPEPVPVTPPPPQQYAPPPQQGDYAPPPQQQYGGPPPQQQYGGQEQNPSGPPPRVYSNDPSRYPDGRYRYRERNDQEPPPPGQEPSGGGGGFKMPPFSIRVDPLNWLLDGRLGFELEAGITSWMTGEIVPIFVTNESPPLLGNVLAGSGRDDSVTQHSNGIGPISGTSIGLGFWLGGEALRGYVLRAIFTNYGYDYQTGVDNVEHTERVLMGMIGSHNRWGIFTIATGIGLGADLNHQTRCLDASTGRPVAGGGSCDGLQVRTRGGDIVDVAGWLYPVVLTGRLSLGISID